MNSIILLHSKCITALAARIEEDEQHLLSTSANGVIKALLAQLVGVLKQLHIRKGRAENAKTASGRLQQQAEEAEQQIRQAEGRAETAQTALKELEFEEEEAARFRNEAPVEVRPGSAAMLVPEQIQAWFCITAGTDFRCHLEPLCSSDMAVVGSYL